MDVTWVLWEEGEVLRRKSPLHIKDNVLRLVLEFGEYTIDLFGYDYYTTYVKDLIFYAGAWYDTSKPWAAKDGKPQGILYKFDKDIPTRIPLYKPLEYDGRKPHYEGIWISDEDFKESLK